MMRWRAFFCAVVGFWALHPMVAAAQTYEQIESQIRRQIEADRASATGDCSEVMVSWLKLRFTQVQQQQGKAHETCAAAQLFALRNGVPFLEVLPKIAVAMGGIRANTCRPEAINDPLIKLYSGCHVSPSPTIDSWSLAREAEVRELGPETLRHIQRCIPRAGVPFAFYVLVDGRIGDFSDAGVYERFGAPPDVARELKKVERALRSDARCNVFPEKLRNRYVSIRSDEDGMRVFQVRDEAAPSR